MSLPEWSSLQPYHTFGLPTKARWIKPVTQVSDLLCFTQSSAYQGLPLLVLGEGSNVLFTNNFAGVVILNQLKGIDIQEDDIAWHIHVGAGESWHELVTFTLEQGIAGMENLALIPGCCGSAPIQNIGAYGVEFEQLCAYVDVLELSTGILLRLSKDECQFGYRDSVFKHQYQNGYVIIAIGLCLPKQWQAVTHYGELTKLTGSNITPMAIFTMVCDIRKRKLPDPKQEGNAGSFFKNPLISASQSMLLQVDFPQIPLYLQPSGEYKVAAGWLIDQCGLKGYQIGQARVHPHQALVLVNMGNACADDVLQLAQYVRRSVFARFSIWLDPEVRFIGDLGEIDAIHALEQK
ncbi:MAG: UDP-N-acetylmuramate dehydrogenase [Plesiomonas sp.]|uniref:UDP-N-acetylmuramate dehydrogenase n=1 Tax=Plesiomonas sp. TaxID=2486279 RepID=UPI003F403451